MNLTEQMENVIALNSARGRFSLIDFLVFGILLIVYMGIGIFFGYIDQSSQTTANEYLHGGRKMNVLPIAISLIASQLSAVTVMATPAEIYAYGTQYMTVLLAFVGTTIILNYVVLPVFYRNNLDNCYKYLEMRFSPSVRHICVVCLYIFGFPSVPIVAFVPSLALAHVFGVNIHVINTVVTFICVLYTTMGGIKAVVWTDVVQAVIMVISILVIMIIAVAKVGGLEAVWTVAIAGNRLQAPNMIFDFTTRNTFWNLFFGYLVTWIGIVGLNQVSCQRILSLRTLSMARRALIIFCIGVCALIFVCCFFGLVMYVNYANCDPVKAGIVEKPDKMVPFFVQEVIGHIPGMPGIFISCVFSASLSTVSAILNSLSGITYNDYIRPMRNFTHTEAKGKLIMKLLTLIFGICCIMVGFVVDKIKSILQIVVAVAGVTQGAICGVFLLGMLWPRANVMGATVGMTVSMFTISWLLLGSLMHMWQGKLVYPYLPSSIEECQEPDFHRLYNTTQFYQEENPAEESFSIYHIAFPWYAVLGFIITWIISILVSLITGTEAEYKSVNPNLIHPMSYFMLHKDSWNQSEIEMENVVDNEDNMETDGNKEN